MPDRRDVSPSCEPSYVKRRRLFEAMIREDDDEKRAELRREYIESLRAFGTRLRHRKITRHD
jgi:hypothetical protein